MSDNPTFDRINEEINDTDVVLFMKGTPMFPQCGFSAAIVGALTQMQVKFKGINVLEDTEIREGIKAFSDWPTIPQMYIKGEFIGGCDIVKEMYEAGELQKMLDDKGITYVSQVYSDNCDFKAAPDEILLQPLYIQLPLLKIF